MQKKYAYFIAVAFLLVVRYGVLNTQYDQWLFSLGYENAAYFISTMKQNPTFNEFVGSWAMPVFVAMVLAYWVQGGVEDATVPMHFLLLPIAYIPFSIVATVLMTAKFQLNYLLVHPLVILPFGYLYVSLWIILIWFFEKLRLVG
ncbi:MAG: hypothetical protein EBV03_00620 [Proteobacteria bacterium]|nr:hypothetical protein [Pseudomonadota bacterium]